MPPHSFEQGDTLYGHSSGTIVADRLARPTRMMARKPACRRLRAADHPYSVLLPVGFTVPVPLPVPRCALTAPFHPCRRPKPVGGLLSVALSLGSPPPGVTRHRVSVEPGLSSSSRNCQRPSNRLTRPMIRELDGVGSRGSALYLKITASRLPASGRVLENSYTHTVSSGGMPLKPIEE
jgi:hypothetical protein